MSEPKIARDAEERGEGICRTCLAPIWNEGGTIGRRKRDTGWSDRIERGGDSLVCFKAVEYRHVPLTGREADIYDFALARGAGMDGEAFDRLIDARVRAGVVAEEPDMTALRAARAETWDEAISAVFAWWSTPENERPAAIVNPYGLGVPVKQEGAET